MATSNNYVLGKGRLFFDLFSPGTRTPLGMRYLGNTPSFTLSRAVTKLDHFDSDGGVKTKDDSVDLESNNTGKFACDNISGDNLALFFGGSVTKITQAATSGSAITETFVAKPGRSYQIGVTTSDPDGLHDLTDMAALIGSTPLVLGTDYTVDQGPGIIHVLPSVTIGTGASVIVSYKLGAATQEVVADVGSTAYGQLKFLANNPKGEQRDAFLPYVQLSADGEFAMKGDTWQQMAFNVEALKLNDTTPRVIITKRAG